MPDQADYLAHDLNRPGEPSREICTVWLVHCRGQGASATAAGSADVRAFQRAVADQTIAVVQGRALMAHAISESSIGGELPSRGV